LNAFSASAVMGLKVAGPEGTPYLVPLKKGEAVLSIEGRFEAVPDYACISGITFMGEK